MAGRGHPSVIAHSVANELSPVPDRTPGTARFLKQAQRRARRADPTLPIAVDIFATPNGAKQKAYESFDLLGINQYFGWYPWTPDLRALAPYLREMRRLYPSHGLVMTEWGAEARPELAGAPASRKGGYGYQALHAKRTLDVIDRSRELSGAIYWTLREFEIYPGWDGGAGPRPPQYEPNTRNHKGLITYEGVRKPAFWVVRERYRRTPLYASR